MHGVYLGQQSKKPESFDISLQFKHPIDATVHYKPLIVAIGEVGRNLINRMPLEEVSNELVADKQIVCIYST